MFHFNLDIFNIKSLIIFIKLNLFIFNFLFIDFLIVFTIIKFIVSIHFIFLILAPNFLPISKFYYYFLSIYLFISYPIYHNLIKIFIIFFFRFLLILWSPFIYVIPDTLNHFNILNSFYYFNPQVSFFLTRFFFITP